MVIDFRVAAAEKVYRWSRRVPATPSWLCPDFRRGSPDKRPEPEHRYHTLVVTVENKSGVLARVASLFARRAFNIESLAVAPTDDENLTRIPVVVDWSPRLWTRSSSNWTSW
ncbi:MAG: hypothetical protein Ct9H300mP12_09430 [Acidimicrobiales bacterium]|nr:MAG: hypothetical protein Ct9H300mP12_09430 [Acidimicrobiales bacterium]